MCVGVIKEKVLPSCDSEVLLREDFFKTVRLNG